MIGGDVNSLRRNRIVRGSLVALGVLLILGSFVIGPLPGPGFLIVFPIGLALVLKNATWSKRLYLRVRTRYPDYGRWTDWALRRRRHRAMPPLPPWRDNLRRWLRREPAPRARAAPPDLADRPEPGSD